jgi:integrase
VLDVESLREDNARTRFLSPAERERLLTACRMSTWKKLNLLVVMAITTGARRGELLRLTYGDLDLASGTAYLRTTKNGEPRVLPLLPAVVEEIKRHGTNRPMCCFSAKYHSDRPMNFDTMGTPHSSTRRLRTFDFTTCGTRARATRAIRCQSS